MNNKTIVIAGGTGFIGTALMQYFAPSNKVIILSRNNPNAKNNAFSQFVISPNIQPNVQLIQWNGKDGGGWEKIIDGSDVVINLTGKSVNCRYTAKNKQAILNSRINATKALGAAIPKATHPPKVWFNAASATIYRNTYDKPQDEFTGEYHNDFSVEVCKQWEQTFFAEPTPLTRKIALRMAITLGKGGVMMPYINLCKWGLGGKQGSGKQMYSWVHIEDLCRAIEFLEQNIELQGVFNISSPNPITNKTFMKELRLAMNINWGLPAYTWMLKIGAAIIGTETELLLKSRWVLPTKLIQAGFKFKYPNLQNAFQQILTTLPLQK
jgi:uncharacterized protein